MDPQAQPDIVGDAKLAETIQDLDSYESESDMRKRSEVVEKLNEIVAAFLRKVKILCNDIKYERKVYGRKRQDWF